MRKPAFCICENKDADQLRGNCEAVQCLCFFAIRIVQSLYFLNFKPLAIFCVSAAWFVLSLVRNPKDRFSYNEAHMIQF